MIEVNIFFPFKKLFYERKKNILIVHAFLKSIIKIASVILKQKTAVTFVTTHETEGDAFQSQ